jgi:uncharacterized protein involved in exopolysaccharide biosynthesis
MAKDISPRESLEHTLNYWWVIALVMILGGVAGWVVAQFATPVYEARASYHVMLDDDALLAEVHKTDPDAELTYEIRAPYLTPVSLVFFNPDVRTAVKEQALADGLDFPLDGFRNGQLTLDNRRTDWTIIVRHADAETAAKLANLWISVADENLQKAREQAGQAESLKLQLSLLSGCFRDSSLSAGNHCAGTSFFDLEEMQAQYREKDRQYREALSASENISSLVNFDVGAPAETPIRPIYYNTGLLMLAGSLLGLILGGVLVQKLPIK